MKEKVQSLGRFLSAMIMPNIGAFIAWGFIAALFIETGWLPNEQLAQLNSPMSRFLLPILIGYTGGRVVDDQRGAVAGAIATMGVIIASENPQFLGAMIMGPLTGYAMKVFDRFVKGRVKAGFEMLVDNFSVGIIGGVFAILAYYIFGPVIIALTNAMEVGVGFFVDHGILPLASILVEPAKVLFLNNAINHGIFTPLGQLQAAETGRSIFFLIESNPGPGLGILLAYCIAGKGSARETAPGAIIIEFLGGIHEIFFPYVLMNPILLVAQIAGGMTGVFIESIMGAGLVAPASPGSILAILALTPGNSILGVLLGVTGATIVSAVIGVPLLKIFGKDEGDLAAAQAQVSGMKSASKGQSAPVSVSANPQDIKHIIFACDAGMGSSAMGATVLANELKKVGRGDIEVEHASVSSIPSHAQIVVTHQDLKERAVNSAPQAEIITITNFMQAPEYGELAKQLSGTAPAPAAEPVEAVVVESNADNDSILKKENIKVNQKAASKEDVIRAAGQMLVDSGYVEPSYIEAMIKREDSFATNIGNGIAIPHGVEEAKAAVKESGISVQTFPETTQWGDSGPVKVVIGIAGKGDDHLDILARIATKLASEETVDELMIMSPEEIQTFFTTD